MRGFRISRLPKSPSPIKIISQLTDFILSLYEYFPFPVVKKKKRLKLKLLFKDLL